MAEAGYIDVTSGTDPSATLASGDGRYTANSGGAPVFKYNGVLYTLVAGNAAGTSSPSDPSGTTDTTGKMMGLAGSFTPSLTGRVVLVATGNIASSAAADGAATQLTYGTGLAPANAGALTGTAVGSIEQITTANTNASKYPFACFALVTGLTLGTAYWYDLRLKAITAGTASVTAITLVAVEV